MLLEDGKWLEFTEDGALRRDPVTGGRVLVDAGSLEEIEEIVVRDRKHLSEEGVVIPIIAIDKHTGRVESAPEIVTRGLMSENGNEMLAGGGGCVARKGEDSDLGGRGGWWVSKEKNAGDCVGGRVENSNVEEGGDWSVIKEKICVDLKRYINKQTSKRPLILPVILEV